ncbi:MAG TPA: LacI family DNA-binding transcriptional regulator [Acidimicrobiales bacterium]|nr:LacI family DNA-binding transcriptional regulator [Acidimicrobiales bacterium]
MADVAALAGVGLRTVSRVMNDDGTVSEGRRAKVADAVSQLHYKPNLTASHLRRRGGRSMVVGLIVHDVAEPFNATLHGAVQSVARAHGYDVLALGGLEPPGREREAVDRLIARRVEGLIIVTPGDNDHRYLQAEQMSGTAIVFLDSPPNFLAADSVVTNNRKAAATAVRQMLDRGHRRVAYLGFGSGAGRLFYTNAERYSGYCDALRRRGIPVTDAYVRQNLAEKLAEEATLELLTRPSPPTAIFSAQPALTVGAIRALQALKRNETTALVGFDDFDAADLLVPGTTVVAQDPVKIGTLAAEILFRRIEGDMSPISQHVLPAKLIERGSGEIPPDLQPRRGRARG